MSKKNHGSRAPNSAFEFLRAGERVPTAFLERRIAAAKRQLEDRATEGQGIKQRYAAYWSQIHEASKGGQGSGDARALKGVLEIHKSLARKRIAAPTPAFGFGGITATSFGVKVTPPFDYAFTMVGDETIGSPTLTYSADKDAGLVEATAITDYLSPSGGFVYSEVGIYFRPKLEPATLRATTSPSCSFQWWINSIQGSQVLTIGEVSFGMYAPSVPKPQGIIGSTEAIGWNEYQPDQLDFKVSVDVVLPSTFQVDHFDTSTECAVFVGALSWAAGRGWPGSLAGAVISVAVPSITLKLDPLAIFV